MRLFGFKRNTCDLSFEDHELLYSLKHLPINTTLRRVYTKGSSGNKWSAQYLHGPVYYAPTLIEAIKKLLSTNKKIQNKILQDHNKKGGYRVIDTNGKKLSEVTIDD